jgi:NAD(P)-dependent dehydrogenase (short-subunit alcohol dehydrogenase family)
MTESIDDRHTGLHLNWSTIWDRVAAAVPDRIAVRTPTAAVTYAELERLSAALAGTLQTSGVERGDRVGLFLYNRIEYLVGMYAAFKLGAVPVNLNFRYREIAEAFDRGAPLPPEVRREHAIGSPDDVAPLVVWLASEAAAGITGQAIGIGGDRLTVYAHPSEAAVAFADGGWSVEGIDAAWRDGLDRHAQPSGITLSPLSEPGA